jgi:ABC-type multidrug transport system permease subunit
MKSSTAYFLPLTLFLIGFVYCLIINKIEVSVFLLGASVYTCGVIMEYKKQEKFEKVIRDGN